jgi:imidazole glycerol-phosphate synthase subunit HisH
MNEPTIIIDYGMGNLGSIANMIKHLGYTSIITSDLALIEAANRIILPGVGHFDRAMFNINSLGITKIVKRKALDGKTPILGICLGMQLLCNGSEEGSISGLGLIDANVRKFQFNSSRNFKVPHMGWNYILKKKNSVLFGDELNELRYYFVHSFYVSCNNPDDILTTTTYGEEFVSSFQKGNICGVQFHPEKSHKFGKLLLRNFIEKL